VFTAVAGAGRYQMPLGRECVSYAVRTRPLAGPHIQAIPCSERSGQNIFPVDVTHSMTTGGCHPHRASERSRPARAATASTATSSLIATALYALSAVSPPIRMPTTRRIGIPRSTTSPQCLGEEQKTWTTCESPIAGAISIAVTRSDSQTMTSHEPLGNTSGRHLSRIVAKCAWRRGSRTGQWSQA